MRIIVWGINYAPELTGIAPYNVALSEFARARGHDAQMLTGFFYYPAWKKREGDRGKVYRTDVMNGVPVHRCWQYVPERVSPLKRIVHEGSFVLTSTIRALTLPRADIYIVVSPPLLLGLAAAVVTTIKQSRFVFYVKDLQPDAAVGLGMLREGWFTKALYWLEAVAYRTAAGVAGISRGMMEIFRQKGVPESKLLFWPDGVALPDPAQFPAPGRFRARNGFGADEFLAVYSGNLGVKQGLDVLIDAAPVLADANVRLVICGDGAQREVLENRVRELGLPNITMLPLQPAAEYQSMLIDSDVCLITQQAGSGNAFFPSKLLSTLAYARPVITVADTESELARAVAEGKFGANVLPGRPGELAEALAGMSRDRVRLEELGAAGRAFVEKFDTDRVLQKLLDDAQALT